MPSKAHLGLGGQTPPGLLISTAQPRRWHMKASLMPIALSASSAHASLRGSGDTLEAVGAEVPALSWEVWEKQAFPLPHTT